MNKERQRLRIAIVVHGKFHAFDLAKALIDRGHDVMLFTNYPKFSFRKENIPTDNVTSFVLHGLLTRISLRIRDMLLGLELPEPWLHRLFGQWAATQVARSSWDIIFCWSGISEELLLRIPANKTLRVLVRGSAHIRAQRILLDEEENRSNTRVDKPSDWMMAREEREYRLANFIRVLSLFSYGSFIQQGVCKERLWLHPSSFPVRRFGIDQQCFEKKRHRILKMDSLRILYIGNLSYQKGMSDMNQIIKSLSEERFKFRLVGERLAETKALFKIQSGNMELCGKKTHDELKKFYQWADLFIFPTIQDGYPQVLAQAFLSGLPILTTTNCSSEEIISEGKTGWIFPIRRPDLFVEKLMWCDKHRIELTNMVNNIESVIASSKFRTWDDVAIEAEDFLALKLNRAQGSETDGCGVSSVC